VANRPLQITKSQMDLVLTNIIQALGQVTEIALLNITPTEVANKQLASLKVVSKQPINQKVV